MQQKKFYQLGTMIYRLRWSIVIFYLVLIACCVPFVPKVMSQFTTTGLVDPASESYQADVLLDNKIGYRRNQFILLYESKWSFTKGTEFIKEIKASLSGLKDFPLKHEIIYPNLHNHQVANNKQAAFAVVLVKKAQDLSAEELEKFKSAIKPPLHLHMKMSGAPIFLDDTKQQTQADLIKAEFIASPVAVITLLIVFGTVIAALVPMVLDGACALFILTLLFFLGHYFSLSIFTLNIALLLGLCLSLDYSLFIISRFREELQRGHDIETTLAITLATAGKAVFFSGLAVMISLSALLMFPINILFSVGVGGAIAVAMAIFVSIILLPAILAILNHRINWLPIHLFSTHALQKQTYWEWMITKVLKRPHVFFIVILSVLLFLGGPFLFVQFGLSDYRILPEHLESRQVFDRIQSDFNQNQLTPISVIVKTVEGPILTKGHIAALYELTHQFKNDPRVERVDSIVSTIPGFSKQQYQMLYTHLDNIPNASVKQLLALTTHENFTVINVISQRPSLSLTTQDLVNEIRHMHLGRGLTIQVTGVTATTVDVFKRISLLFPYALLWIGCLTYLALLILLRSVILPIKAIVMTVLSLSASYGILVLVVQMGYFSQLLHFQPQGMVDISLVIIIFCALFGFSMDYEVFLLSRIKEHYEKTNDNLSSIHYGIIQSSRIISSAAIIVILICFSFISANVLLVKAFGLGIAAAIFVDAFLIRTMLVPAAMALLGKWNWYAPKWLAKRKE